MVSFPDSTPGLGMRPVSVFTCVRVFVSLGSDRQYDNHMMVT